MVQMWEIVGGADKGGIIVRHQHFMLLHNPVVSCDVQPTRWLLRVVSYICM
jgi:hypothetical protein